MKRFTVVVLAACFVLSLLSSGSVFGETTSRGALFGIGAKFYGSTPMLTLSSTGERFGADLTVGLWSASGFSLLWLGGDAKAYVPIQALGSLLRPYLGGGAIALLATFGGLGASIVGFDGVLGMEVAFHSIGAPVAVYLAAQYVFFPALGVASGLGTQFGVRLDF